MGNLKIIIFDVEHGFCAFVRSPDGHTLLIDCGAKDNFSPIKYIWDSEIQGNSYSNHLLDIFILSHPHDDHLTDIEKLKENFRPLRMIKQEYKWNEIKQTPDRDKYKNLDIYSNWQETYNYPLPDLPLEGMRLVPYWLTPAEAKNLSGNFVNNSSIVVCLEYQGFKILFPGDLEEAGWQELLKRVEFRNLIKNTSVLVASHHGHTSGYCPEIFGYMYPDCVIVSDHKKDNSDEEAYSHSDKVKGIPWNGGCRRKLSTRNDGSIFIEVSGYGNWNLENHKLKDNI